MIYVIERKECDRNEFDAFVVRASSEQDARHICSTNCGAEQAKAWLNRNESVCRTLAIDGDYGVILGSFNRAPCMIPQEHHDVTDG